jgi:hypothetical protein
LRIGITGHRTLEAGGAWDWVRREITAELSRLKEPLTGVSSLAAGADQIFAEAVQQCGGSLVAVIPFEDYERTFGDPVDLARYQRLSAQALTVEKLRAGLGEEEAYLEAGARVVNLSERLIAVWDGREARGVGGTAEIVDIALQLRIPVIHINPVTRSVTLLNFWNSLPSGYGEKKADDHSLEQYKLFVESSHKVTDRRLLTNSFMLTLNSSLLTLMGAGAGVLPSHKPLVLLCGAGIALSFMWISLLESSRRLNAAKFKVIEQLEARLPARVFQEETRHLRLGRHKAFSITEKVVPWTMIVVYCLTGIVLLLWKDETAKKVQAITIDRAVHVEVDKLAK